MPQLDFNLFFGNIYSLEVVFVFLYLGIYFFFIPKQSFGKKFSEKFKRFEVSSLETKEKGKIVEEYLYLLLLKGIEKIIVRNLIKNKLENRGIKKIERIREGVIFYLTKYKKRELEWIQTEFKKDVSSFRAI